MTWEDRVIRTASKGAAKAAAMDRQVVEHCKNLVSAIIALYPAMEGYRSRFSDSGIVQNCRLRTPGGDRDCQEGSWVNISFAAADHRIWGYITVELRYRGDDEYDKPQRLPWIKVSYGSHERSRTIRYDGPIPESAVMKWIHFATRELSIVDRIIRFWRTIG